MRRLVVFLLFVLLATVAGCAGDGGGREGKGSKSSGDAAVAQAARKTAQAGSYRASFEVKYEGLTRKSVSVTGEGVFDAKDGRGRMTLDMRDLGEASGQPLGEAQIVFDELVFYMNLPALTRQSSKLKPWLKFDLEALSKQQGVDLGQLAQLNQADPSQALRYLRGAGEDVKEVGDEDVRGEPTTHYRLTVDLDKVARRSPMQKANIERVIEQSGIKDVPTDVWVDAEGRARRLRLAYEGFRFSPDKKGDMTMAIELYDFGLEVDVRPPPASRVTDLVELVGQQGSS